jgi:hypothetical protein
MGSFNTRIELHEANYQDYVNLHSYMAHEGYTTTIVANDGSRYHLPTAEYNLVDNCTIAQALEKAQRAAQKTRKRFAAGSCAQRRAPCAAYFAAIAHPAARLGCRSPQSCRRALPQSRPGSVGRWEARNELLSDLTFGGE